MSSAPNPIRMPASVLLTMVLSVGHFSMNRRFKSLAETRLPPNMQTEITAPATGIETIDPTDAVIENPGAKTARIVKVIPIAPIDSVSRMKLDSDLSDTPSLSARMANSASARSTWPKRQGSTYRRLSRKQAEQRFNVDHRKDAEKGESEVDFAISEMPDRPEHTSAVHIGAEPEQHGCRNQVAEWRPTLLHHW